MNLIRQESEVQAIVPHHLLETVARFTRLVRQSPAIDARSGVSARFAVACTESIAASALRRAAITGEAEAVARIGDLEAVVPTLHGKVEFEVSEEGREDEVLVHLTRRATAETFRARLGGVDLSPLVAWFDEGGALETGDLVPAAAILASIGPLEGLGRVVTALEGDAGESEGIAAACLELALEGLWLTRRIGKDTSGSTSTYGGGSG